MNKRRGNHNGGIYEHQDRKNKPWEARIRVPPYGKQKSFYFRTKTEAEAKLREVGRMVDLKQSLPTGRQTVAQFASDRLEKSRKSSSQRPCSATGRL